MMYYKIINDRQVFNDCRTIQLNGTWISNPSQQQIANAGWQVYTPPIVPPQPQTEPGIAEVMQAVKRMLSSETSELSDEDALAVAAMFPTYVSMIGKQVSTGKRLWWDGKLYKVLQPHTVSQEWTPDTAVSLYVEVSIEEIPDWRQPTGAQDVYMAGDKAKHNGHTWESTVDYNSWEPGVFGWQQLD